MNKTPNYQLSQWAKSDRVLMDDFNADNAKLDAALKANADAISAETSARTNAVSALEERSALQVIKTATVSAAAQTYTLSLSGIGWYQWREVVVAAHIILSGSGTPVYTIIPEGLSDSGAIGGSTRPMVVLFYPARSSSFPMAGLSLGNTPQFFSRESFSRLTGLRFQATSGGAIAAGSSITVYGLK